MYKIKNIEVPSFKINGKTIQEVDNVKYLGHFISNTLRDDKDILRQCGNADNYMLGVICYCGNFTCVPLK